MNEKRLRLLANENLISYSKGTSLEPCDYCLFGKQHRVSFGTTSKLKTNVLDLVCSNVCGPVEVNSSGDSRYFFTFSDDASRNTKIKG